MAEDEDGRTLLYVDRHLTHEVTSPIAFESLRERGMRVRRPESTFAVMDHNVPTAGIEVRQADRMSTKLMEALRKNCRENRATLFDNLSPLQGIVHVIGPELGLTLPGLTVACGDSHTATHGALGAIGIGIGTSEGEHVFATQALWLKRPKEMRISVRGRLAHGVYPKDVVMYVIRSIGTGGAIGHAVEFAGETVRGLSVEGRMTLTNMVVEAGARTAIISPDDKVFEYVRGALYAPRGDDWNEAMRYWSSLRSDNDSPYDAKVEFDVSALEPQVSWGTNPAMTVGVTESVPSPSDCRDEKERIAVERALRYMGLRGGMKITEIKLDAVFIGSCTNARITDLVEAARVVKGKRARHGIRAIVVPGSQSVKARAEELGLDKVFVEAGFEWRNSGCSMCIAMNGDRLEEGERCASTSNRNFENRQGTGGRTHLVSPAMAAAAAIEGRFVDVRGLDLAEPEEVFGAAGK